MLDPELSSRYWLCRKVICLVGYYGGFRNTELKSLLFENVECDKTGYWFSFARSKQRNKLEETTICVPRRQSDWIPCAADSARKAVDYDPASVIDSYYEAVLQDLFCKREELKGGFFKGTHGKAGKRFVNSNVGKNTLALVGIEIATELCLRDPETYTGHCWRRSAGTNASNSGVNVTTLMSMMGWSCPKTAMQYVKRSRVTSLQMSMYLANVQRRNCSDPFPSGTARVSRKKKFRSEEKLAHLSNVVAPTSSSSSGFSSLTPTFSTSTSSFPTTKVAVIPATSSTTAAATAAAVVVSSASATTSKTTSSSSLNEFESGLSNECVNVDIKDDVVQGSVNSSSRNLATNSATYSSEEGHVVSALSNSLDLSSVDPRLMNFLQNLNNHGSIQIHFNFGDLKK